MRDVIKESYGSIMKDLRVISSDIKPSQKIELSDDEFFEWASHLMHMYKANADYFYNRWFEVSKDGTEAQRKFIEQFKQANFEFKKALDKE